MELESDGFGHWLAGFVDGEGSFLIRPATWGGYACWFSILLRADDAPVLREIAARTGIGRLDNRPSTGLSHPSTRWLVYKRADCKALVELFDRYPLRAKKLRDYLLWKEAVIEWLSVDSSRLGQRPKGSRRDWSRMAGLYKSLRAIRAFRPEVTAG